MTSESSAPLTQEFGKSIQFYDGASERWMKYVYPKSDHWTAGWILYQHPDGQWVTLRKATDADIKAINRAVVEGHHSC